MSNKEILSLRIMGKDISIACPPEDKPGLEAAANLLNQDIDLIPDKANALILASLNLAFKQMNGPSSDSIDSKIEETIERLSTNIEKALS
jgi:cell division protein ZapA (FtsZ GTPase activity inhibitor)